MGKGVSFGPAMSLLCQALAELKGSKDVARDVSAHVSILSWLWAQYPDNVHLEQGKRRY